MNNKIITDYLELKRSNPDLNDGTHIKLLAKRYTYNTKQITQLLVEYKTLKNKQWALDHRGYIRKYGFVVEDCRKLTGGQRHNKAWLFIEKAALLFSLWKHEGEDSTHQAAMAMADYLQRDPKAVARQAYKLKKDRDYDRMVRVVTKARKL